MPRSDEAQAFVTGVYMAVQEIPYGKVTTYGHIAKLIGRPQNPRQVGQALKHLPNPSTADVNNFHHNNVPWQRVISSGGIIAVRDDPSGANRHAAALRNEGVNVQVKPDGRLWVDLATDVAWFPEYLPSEEADFLGGVGEENP